jgi:hypothetical protein
MMIIKINKSFKKERTTTATTVRYIAQNTGVGTNLFFLGLNPPNKTCVGELSSGM